MSPKKLNCHTKDETATQPKTKASDRNSRFPMRSASPVSSPSSCSHHQLVLKQKSGSKANKNFKDISECAKIEDGAHIICWGCR